jgi:hypothetical protein
MQKSAFLRIETNSVSLADSEYAIPISTQKFELCPFLAKGPFCFCNNFRISKLLK